jgi:hypothetical protein
MKINSEQYFGYLKQYRGENLFFQPTEKDKIKAKTSLDLIQSKTKIAIPPVYKKFYLRLFPFKWEVDFDKFTERDEYVMIHCLSTGGLSYLHFEEFLIDKDIILGWEWVVGDLNKEYNWDIIRIGRFTQGDLYMGFGEQNIDKIYWVHNEELYGAEDNDYKNPSWKDCYGIRYIAKDIEAFVRTLSLGYDTMDYL